MPALDSEMLLKVNPYIFVLFCFPFHENLKGLAILKILVFKEKRYDMTETH
jgi:hypothetical protein